MAGIARLRIPVGQIRMELKVGAGSSRKPAPGEVTLGRRTRDGQRARQDMRDLLRGVTLVGGRDGRSVLVAPAAPEHQAPRLQSPPPPR